MATAPLYNVNDPVYLKESAAVGYLERLKVQAIMMDPSGQWAYGFRQESTPEAVPTVSDRINHQFRRQVYYGEGELVDYCAALALAKAYYEAQLVKIVAMQASCT